MSIDIMKIAKLAYLKIEDNEIEAIEKKMNDIIAMVGQLPDVAVGDSKPRVEDAMELRKDEVTPSTSRDKLLASAPQAVAGCIVVPKTVE